MFVCFAVFLLKYFQVKITTKTTTAKLLQATKPHQNALCINSVDAQALQNSLCLCM